MGGAPAEGGEGGLSERQQRVRAQEIWIAWVRLLAVVWAVGEVGVATHGYPPGYHRWAWLVTGVLGTGALVFFWLARRDLSPRAQSALGFSALLFDTLIVYAYVFIYAFEPAIPAWGLRVLPAIEAGVRYGVRGGAVLPLAALPLGVAAELFRADRFSPPPFELRFVSLPAGIQLLTGLIVGGLVKQLWHETTRAEERAAEAEELRDEIGRHADQLEVVNRSGRALASSLELEEAFRLFVREVRTALAFDRLALVLAQHDRAHVMAAVDNGEDDVFPPGGEHEIAGSVLEAIMRDGQTVVSADMTAEGRFYEEAELAAAGLRSRVAAPLVLAGRPLGMIAVSRRAPHAFSRDEVHLVTLLGRQLATAVENIRAFERERSAAEELRRLSALRADFVSLVSHELRGPMASVVGCAATLRQRWRSLTPDQRESFLGLIEEETARLAELVGDVLDTSRVEAGTFSYSFAPIDVGQLVREVAAVVDLGQEEVTVRADVPEAFPPVRADRDRMRQLLMNLVTNAVKYTVPGDEVKVSAECRDAVVSVRVRDNGPGISAEDQRRIFEKFGRAGTIAGGKPGTGLGLFIARSIAEAHGGSLDVSSREGAGATFTVQLPAVDW